jgi:predicted MFS family arabinose efflux permease
MKSDQPNRLLGPIAGITFFRLVLNTAKRFAYPFAPALSRGMGVSLTAVTSLIAVNQVTTLLGLLIGPLSDRLGYRKMMLCGMSLLAVGMLAASILPTYAVVLVALFLAGLGKSILDPAVQAWTGSRVPYERRALVVGVLETSWAMSTLIGIPLVAVLMDRYGWRSPFLAMGLLGVIGVGSLAWIIPKESMSVKTEASGSWSTYLGAYAKLIGSKPAMGALGYAFFVSAANDNLFVVYGAWLEKRFGLGLVALGVGTSLIGAAELLGEGFTATVADRLGLRRALIGGLSLTVVGYFLLPFLDTSLASAMTGLALLFLVFEFSMVTSISIATELLPDHRATMMAGFFATAGIGRMVGALMGAAVWQAGGIQATGWVSSILTLLGMACLLMGLRTWKRSDG